MHFDPTQWFVESDGIYVGTYFQRINSIFEKERRVLKNCKKDISKLEQRISNTQEMIDLYSQRFFKGKKTF